MTPLPLPSAAPLTPGWYIRVRREAAGSPVEELALLLPMEPAVPALSRAEYIRAVEAGIQPVTIDLALALQRALDGFHIDVLFALVNVALGWVDLQFLPPLCAVCGCKATATRCPDCGAALK